MHTASNKGLDFRTQALRRNIKKNTYDVSPLECCVATWVIFEDSTLMK
jgi:hypothetical protein